MNIRTADGSTEPRQWNTGFRPEDAVKKAEVACIGNRSLVQIEFCASHDQRSINRRVGMRVGIIKLDLIDTHRSIVIVMRLCKLPIYPTRKPDDAQREADEEQRFPHASSVIGGWPRFAPLFGANLGIEKYSRVPHLSPILA